MGRRAPRTSSLRHGALIGASAALACLAVTAAMAEQIHWPWQRPAYRQAPAYRSGTMPSRSTNSVTRTSPPASAAAPVQRTVQPYTPPQPAPSRTTQTQPAPAPAETLAAEPRRPQAIQPSANSAESAAACMNERKAAPADLAIKSCDAVIGETVKNLANAYYFRGVARAGKEDFDGAIADYGQALRLDPSDPDYLNSRASAYESKNDLGKALADYDQAIKANPGSVYAYNNRGAAYQRKGDYARAAADYGEVTRLQPNNMDAWSARCWVRAISPGQTQQALSDCNQALKIKSDAADVLDTRGFVYLKLGQNDNAIKDYDAALKIDPKLAGSLYGRGLAKTRRGDRTGGLADVALAKSIKSDIADEFSRYGLRP